MHRQQHAYEEVEIDRCARPIPLCSLSTLLRIRNNNTVLGSAGFHGDILTLVKAIGQRMTHYKFTHGKEMRCVALYFS